MNVYLLTNLVSGAKALVFAQVEYEARYRRPDGAVWRVGHWYEAGGRRPAADLRWWPGSPHDVVADPVMEAVDPESMGPRSSPLLAVQHTHRPVRVSRRAPVPAPRPPEPAPEPRRNELPETPAQPASFVAPRRPRRPVIEPVPDTV